MSLSISDFFSLFSNLQNIEEGLCSHVWVCGSSFPGGHLNVNIYS